MSGRNKEIRFVDLDSLEDAPTRPAVSEDATEPSQPAAAPAEREDTARELIAAELADKSEPRSGFEAGGNRRSEVRHPMISLVDVFEQKKNRNLGRVSDLSVRGFKVVTLNAIMPGTMMPLTLVPQSQLSGSDEVHVQGICRWCRPVAGDVYRVGFEFIDVDEDSKQALVGLIHRLPG